MTRALAHTYSALQTRLLDSLYLNLVHALMLGHSSFASASASSSCTKVGGTWSGDGGMSEKNVPRSRLPFLLSEIKKFPGVAGINPPSSSCVCVVPVVPNTREHQYAHEQKRNCKCYRVWMIRLLLFLGGGRGFANNAKEEKTHPKPKRNSHVRVRFMHMPFRVYTTKWS